MPTVFSAHIDPNARWQVPLWGSETPSHGFWYIYDTLTGRFVKIGRVGARRANYCDQAVAEAKRRNEESK